MGQEFSLWPFLDIARKLKSPPMVITEVTHKSRTHAHTYTTGLNWTVTATNLPNQVVKYVGPPERGYFVFNAAPISHYMASQDGINWFNGTLNSADVLASVNWLPSVKGGLYYIASSTTGNVWYSTGLKGPWQLTRNGIPTGGVTDIHASPTTYVAVGIQGNFIYTGKDILP